ncbi:hypothetical protein [Bacteroides ovatus]|uniref:hypothetical protein n=1 Tax=Bacteroides ovatus TaxID=28116 RepID=UPI00189F24B2|nr:hypothetical protein [Bacteroides ovatus]
MMENSEQNLEYALSAIQEPQLRETEEFYHWISIPENKELFLDLLAFKEAAMRESRGLSAPNMTTHINKHA